VTKGNWIVCEGSQRWSSALRLRLGKRDPVGKRLHRLVEVRGLAEITPWLSEQPTSLVCIEVDQANFADVLAWLPAARCDFDHARLIALADYSLQPSPWETHREARVSWQDADAALREAGAAMVVQSPRDLGPLENFGRRHAASVSSMQLANDPHVPLTAKMWASLPWQAG
jgi:hypothetical protein